MFGNAQLPPEASPCNKTACVLAVQISCRAATACVRSTTPCMPLAWSPPPSCPLLPSLPPPPASHPLAVRLLSLCISAVICLLSLLLRRSVGACLRATADSFVALSSDSEVMQLGMLLSHMQLLQVLQCVFPCTVCSNHGALSGRPTTSWLHSEAGALHDAGGTMNTGGTGASIPATGAAAGAAAIGTGGGSHVSSGEACCLALETPTATWNGELGCSPSQAVTICFL